MEKETRVALRNLNDASQPNIPATVTKKVTLKRKRRTDSVAVKKVVVSKPEVSPEYPSLPKPVPLHNARKDHLLDNYEKQILEYMAQLDSKHSLSADYLEKSKIKFTSENRAVLIDWIIEISGHCRSQPETLYLGVKLLDIFLSGYPISKSRVQLAGLVAFWIAMKVEEYSPLDAEECVSYLGGYGNKQSLLRMERLILQVLQFRTVVAEPAFYLRRALCYVENGDDKTFVDTCTYCLDSSLVHVATVAESASDLAAAALYAARLIFGDSSWTEALGYVTGHWPTPDKLRPLARIMVVAILQGQDGDNYSGAYKKYSRRSYGELARSPFFRQERLRSIVEYLQNP